MREVAHPVDRPFPFTKHSERDPGTAGYDFRSMWPGRNRIEICERFATTSDWCPTVSGVGILLITAFVYVVYVMKHVTSTAAVIGSPEANVHLPSWCRWLYLWMFLWIPVVWAAACYYYWLCLSMDPGYVPSKEQAAALEAANPGYREWATRVLTHEAVPLLPRRRGAGRAEALTESQPLLMQEASEEAGADADDPSADDGSAVPSLDTPPEQWVPPVPPQYHVPSVDEVKENPFMMFGGYVTLFRKHAKARIAYEQQRGEFIRRAESAAESKQSGGQGNNGRSVRDTMPANPPRPPSGHGLMAMLEGKQDSFASTSGAGRYTVVQQDDSAANAHGHSHGPNGECGGHGHGSSQAPSGTIQLNGKHYHSHGASAYRSDVMAKGEAGRHGLRKCYTCDVTRPPLSSHCGRCNSCMSMYDHHCDFIAGCVGQRIHVYFVRFVSAVSLYIISMLALSVIAFAYADLGEGFTEGEWRDVDFAAGFIMVAAVLNLCCMAPLTLTHLELVSSGQSMKMRSVLLNLRVSTMFGKQNYVREVRRSKLHNYPMPSHPMESPPTSARLSCVDRCTMLMNFCRFYRPRPSLIHPDALIVLPEV